MSHFVSASCRGAKCNICGNPATHKVGEEMFDDDPQPVRHNATAYVCCSHFHYIMGNNSFVDSICPLDSEDIRFARRVLHHNNRHCKARLSENGFCRDCEIVPDRKDAVFLKYCPTCDLPLSNGNKCPSCGIIYK